MMTTSITMSAWFGGYAPTLVTRQVSVPEPGPTQVLVKARAWALNNADVPALDAAFTPGAGPGTAYLAGYEFAGDVVAAGAAVSGLPAGTAVMGTTPASFAEYVLCDYRHLLRKPPELPYAEAAALTTALLTEFGALAASGFTSGATVAITGATSAIALVGVQVARVLGAAQVIGTSRSDGRARLVTATGADSVVVTSRQDLTDALLEATGGAGVDIVLDHVGGELLAASLPGTRKGGSIVNIGRLGGTRADIDIDALSYRHLTLRGVSFGFTPPELIGDLLRELAPILLPGVANGQIHPVIDSRFAFQDAPEAVAHLRTGQPCGKVILTMP